MACVRVQDAMQFACESRQSELAEDLLNWFLDQKLYDAFSACLYSCYDLVKPDVVLIHTW